MHIPRRTTLFMALALSLAACGQQVPPRPTLQATPAAPKTAEQAPTAPAPQAFSLTRQWVRQPDLYEGFLDVKTDSQGNVYVVGGKLDPASDPSCGTRFAPDCISDPLLAKFDPNGKLLWERTFGTDNPSEAASDLAVDEQGNVYVAGIAGKLSPDAEGEPDQWGRYTTLVKFDAQGKQQWVKQNSPSLFFISDLAVDRAGHLSLLVNPGNVPTGPSVVSYDPAGHQVWKRDLGKAYALAEAVFTVSPTGDIFVSAPSTKDVALLRFSANGTPVWERHFKNEARPGSYAKPLSVVVAGEGVYIAWTASEVGENYEAFLKKYRTDGTWLWNHALDLPHEEGELAGLPASYEGNLAADAAGHLYLSATIRTRTRIEHESRYRGYLGAFDTDGKVLWSTSFRSAQGWDVYPNDLAVDAGGNVFQAGSVEWELSGTRAEGRHTSFQGFLIRWKP